MKNICRRMMAALLAVALIVPTSVTSVFAECNHESLYPTNEYDWTNAASGYHNIYRECKSCGASVVIGTAKHTMKMVKYSGDGRADQDYYPPGYNSGRYQCTKCYYTTWEVDLAAVEVYKTSTKIKLGFDFPLEKGTVLKVKIGKKIYQKKITKASKSDDYTTYTLKIKKPKKNSKITIYLLYKGKTVTYDGRYVLSRKYPKKGMTMKQVRYTSWGYPYKVVKKAGGYTYWYWGDASRYLLFKNGKVLRWTKGLYGKNWYKIISAK